MRYCRKRKHIPQQQVDLVVRLTGHAGVLFVRWGVDPRIIGTKVPTGVPLLYLMVYAFEVVNRKVGGSPEIK